MDVVVPKGSSDQESEGKEMVGLGSDEETQFKRFVENKAMEQEIAEITSQIEQIKL